MPLKRSTWSAGQVVVLQHTSKILKGNALRWAASLAQEPDLATKLVQFVSRVL